MSLELNLPSVFPSFPWLRFRVLKFCPEVSSFHGLVIFSGVRRYAVNIEWLAQWLCCYACRSAGETAATMIEKKQSDSMKKVIISLLHYCEELFAQRGAYQKILADHMNAQSAQELFDGEIQETRQRLEPAFHALWAHLREEDWQGLARTLQQELGRLEPQ